MKCIDGPTELTTAEAMNVIRQAMREDPGYAWTWHCNIACLLLDEGVAHDRANDRASGFMKLAFDVETKAPERDRHEHPRI
jgi:hypothetical protein